MESSIVSYYLKHFLLFLTILATIHAAGQPCILRPYKTGMVCICNSTYCDTLEFNQPKDSDSFVIVSTSEQGLRFFVNYDKFIEPSTMKISDESRYSIWPDTRKNEVQLEQTFFNIFESKSIISWFMGEKRNAETEKYALIKIDHSIKYQKILGFGGALTGSVAHLFDTMNTNLTKSLYKSYFSTDKGIGFTIMRTSIGGCDFDLVPWAYNEVPRHDAELSNFSRLDDRDLLKIKQLNQIKRIAKNNDIKLIAAAWSPPKWMKTNNDWTGFSALRAEYYETWADYHLKYLQLMQEQNVSVWAISTGNEPMNGVVFWMFVPFMSLGWTPVEQGRWVAEHLGPKLKESEFENVLLFAGDDQRYTFPWWFIEMARGNNKSLDYVDGFAVHWYWDSFVPPGSTIDKTKGLYPEKLILNTESCLGDKPYDHHGPVLGSWSRATVYIMNMFQDLQHSINGWIDWNLVLNEEGGPNYVKNFVDAPIIVNTTTNDEAYKQPIFYVLGHFSRFILPDSIRIKATSSDFNVKVLAFERPDSSTALIFYNSHNTPVNIRIEDNTKGVKNMVLPPLSLHSMLYF